MTVVNKSYKDIFEVEMNQILQLKNSIIVDVREQWEFDEFNIGGLNIPLAEIREHRDTLLPFQHIVIVCTNGIRSKIAARDFCRAEQLQDKEFYHLAGGLLGVED